MFKKITLVLLFLLIPSYSHASTDIYEIDWINFNWNDVSPDKYTIDLARMYEKVDKNIQDSDPKMYFYFSNNFDKNVEKDLIKYYLDATKFFGLKTSIAYINDENAGPFSRQFLKNNGVDAAGFDEWMDKRQNTGAGAYVQQNNMSYHHTYFYINVKNTAEWKISPVDYEATVHHETAHVYWYDLVDRKNSKYMGPHNQSNCWMFEGFANAFGQASYAYYTNSENKRNYWIKKLNMSLPEISYENKNNLINYFHENKNDLSFCMQKMGGYTVGMLLIEYLYSNYGFNEVNLLMKEFEKRSNSYWVNGLKAKNNIFEDLLKEMFKVDSNYFYSNFFDYLIYTYQKTIDQNK
jgi:hypothetical protein